MQTRCSITYNNEDLAIILHSTSLHSISDQHRAANMVSPFSWYPQFTPEKTRNIIERDIFCLLCQVYVAILKLKPRRGVQVHTAPRDPNKTTPLQSKLMLKSVHWSMQGFNTNMSSKLTGCWQRDLTPRVPPTQRSLKLADKSGQLTSLSSYNPPLIKQQLTSKFWVT